MSGVARGPHAGVFVVDDLGFSVLEWPAPWSLADDGLSGGVHRIRALGDEVYVLTGSGAYRADERGRFERLPWTDDEAWDLVDMPSGARILADSYALKLIGPDGRIEPLGEPGTPRGLLPSRFHPGRLYVATEFGLRILEQTAIGWRVLYDGEGERNITVRQLVETDAGTLWFGSERGGVRRLDFEASGSDPSGSNLSGSESFTEHAFTQSDGLNYGEVADEGYVFDVDGVIHAFTPTGIHRWTGDRFETTAFGGLAELATADVAFSYARADDSEWAWTHARLLHRARGEDWHPVALPPVMRGGVAEFARIDGRPVFGGLGALLVGAAHGATIDPAPPELRVLSARLVESGEAGQARALPFATSSADWARAIASAIAPACLISKQSFRPGRPQPNSRWFHWHRAAIASRSRAAIAQVASPERRSRSSSSRSGSSARSCAGSRSWVRSHCCSITPPVSGAAARAN